MKTARLTALFALLSLTFSFPAFAMEEDPFASNDALLKEEYRTVLREFLPALRHFKTSLELLAEVNHQYLDENGKPYVISIPTSNNSAITYANNNLRVVLKNYLNNTIHRSMFATEKEYDDQLHALTKKFFDTTGHAYYHFEDNPSNRSAWLQLQHAKTNDEEYNVLQKLLASQNSDIQKMAQILRCMNLSNTIVERLTQASSYLFNILKAPDDIANALNINQLGVGMSILMKQLQNACQYEEQTNKRFGYYPIHKHDPKSLSPLVTVSAILKTLESMDLTASPQAPNKKSHPKKNKTTKKKNGSKPKKISPQQQHPIEEEDDDELEITPSPIVHDNKKSSSTKAEVSAPTLTYAQRIESWFDEASFTTLTATKTPSSIIYHRFPKIIDAYLYQWGVSRPAKENQKSYGIFGEIRSDDGTHQYVQYHMTMDKNGIIYHRGIEPRSFKEIEQAYKAGDSNPAWDILNREDNFPALGSIKPSNNTRADGIIKEDDFIITIRDNFLGADFIIYKPFKS